MPVVVIVTVIVAAVVVVVAGRLCILRQLIFDGHSTRPRRHEDASPTVILPRLRDAYRRGGHPPARVLRPLRLKSCMCADMSLAVYNFGTEAVWRKMAV